MAVPTEANRSIRKVTARILSGPASALWIGFTALLLLMAGMAVDATVSLRNVEVATMALRAESRQRDGLLDQLRTDIYRSSTVMRDHLLEMDDPLAESQKAELEHLRTLMDQTLRNYQSRLPELEKAAFEDLHRRVGMYWKSLAPALQWSAASRKAKGASFLQDVVMPLRTELVQLTRQINELNDRDLDAREDRIQEMYSQFRRRVAVVSTFALVLGLGVGTVSIRLVRHWEREAKARYAEVADAHLELQKLSNRLVTAQEEERRNLSRELHDEVGQAMTALLVELGRVETAADSETRSERLASARHMAQFSVDMVRNMALVLRPSMLDDLGLVAALRWQAREVTRRTGLRVKMVADEIAEDLPDSYRTCVYRVVQEALNNCAKHSKASQVRVVVHRDEDGLSVTVQDDGVGFEPRKEKGLGLLGMEERVVRLGGSFLIESAPGNGTVLSIHFPFINDGPASEKEIV